MHGIKDKVVVITGAGSGMGEATAVMLGERAKVSDLAREAIRLLGSLEGIVLDPVYAGRSMGALIDLIRKEAFRSDETVLFWHTAPALVAYAKDLI